MASNSGGGGHGASMKSWAAAIVITIGFVVGGIAIILWNWPMFWVAVGVTAVGAIYGWSVGIMDEVTEYGGGDNPGGDPQTTGAITPS